MNTKKNQTVGIVKASSRLTGAIHMIRGHVNTVHLINLRLKESKRI